MIGPGTCVCTHACTCMCVCTCTCVLTYLFIGDVLSAHAEVAGGGQRTASQSPVHVDPGDHT